jgi:hypothetical protein
VRWQENFHAPCDERATGEGDVEMKISIVVSQPTIFAAAVSQY